MNPLTNVRNILNLNKRELELGVSFSQSWHQQYRDSAWIFVGGLDYDLTEGDVICVFSQYGEVVNINLIRDKKSGKSKGFAFLCYENQLSTVLAVDNLNSIKLCGRTIRVDHVEEYKVPRMREDMTAEQLNLALHGCAPQALTDSVVDKHRQRIDVKKEYKPRENTHSPVKLESADADGLVLLPRLLTATHSGAENGGTINKNKKKKREKSKHKTSKKRSMRQYSDHSSDKSDSDGTLQIRKQISSEPKIVYGKTDTTSLISEQRGSRKEHRSDVRVKEEVMSDEGQVDLRSSRDRRDRNGDAMVSGTTRKRRCYDELRGEARRYEDKYESSSTHGRRDR